MLQRTLARSLRTTNITSSFKSSTCQSTITTRYMSISNISKSQHTHSFNKSFHKYIMMAMAATGTMATMYYHYKQQQQQQQQQQLKQQHEQQEQYNVEQIINAASLLNQTIYADDKNPEVPAQEEEEMPYWRTWFSYTAWKNWYQNLVEPPKKKLLPPAIVDANSRIPRTLIVEIDGLLAALEWDRDGGWRIKPRPGFQFFLTRMMAAGYEVVFWAGRHPSFLGEALIASIPNAPQLAQHRLFKEHVNHHEGDFIKDLSRLGRDLSRVIVLDWNSDNVRLQSENALLLPKYEGEDDDDVLFRYVPFLESMIKEDTPDVREVLRAYRGQDIPQVYYEKQKKRESLAKKLKDDQGRLPLRTSISK